MDAREARDFEWEHLPPDFLGYRSQIEAFLADDDAGRKRTVHAAFHAGNFPPGSLYTELAEVRDRAGPEVQAAAVVYVLNESDSKRFRTRLNFFRSIIPTLEAHVRAKAIGTDAAPEGAGRGIAHDPRNGAPRKSKDIDPAEAFAAIRAAARASRVD